MSVEPVCPRSPCAHGACVPEEPMCPWSPCVHGARVPMEPVCPRSPCVHGARVPMEPVCPRSPCVHGACGFQMCEFAPDLESGSCPAGKVSAGSFTSWEGAALFQSVDGGCLKTHNEAVFRSVP